MRSLLPTAQVVSGREVKEGNVALVTGAASGRWLWEQQLMEMQDPAVTAELCFAGMARRDFLAITDPKILGFAERRHRELEDALDRIPEG